MSCQRCSKELGPRRQKYCSDECKIKSRNDLRSPGRTKDCEGCKESFNDTSRVNNCKLCPDCFKFRSDVYKYKITGKQAKELRAITNCQSCGSAERLCIDHNHKTGKVRGVICHKCNSAIGLFNEDIQLMKRAAAYLRGEI